MTLSKLFTRSALVFVALIAFALSGSAAFAATTPAQIHISNNWAGYAATNDTYSGVSGTWVVPNSTRTSNVISADAAWIGIGGVSTSDLIQAGTQAVIRNGTTQYTAWYELLPDTQQTVPLTIHAGDQISASVNQTSTDNWLIAITDLTTSQTYQATVQYHSSLSSAEWIVERPLAITGNATGYLPLSNFGSVTFQNANATTATGRGETVQTSGAEPLIMGSGNSRILAQPQIVNDNSLTVSYLSSSQSSQYLRTLRREYTLKPETNASAPSIHYQQINTSFIIHVIF